MEDDGLIEMIDGRIEQLLGAYRGGWDSCETLVFRCGGGYKDSNRVLIKWDNEHIPGGNLEVTLQQLVSKWNKHVCE